MTTISDLPSAAVFDLETTGVDLETTRIVTAYVGLMLRDGTIWNSKSWLVDPGIDIPEAATKVHGITTEQARANGLDAGAAIADIRRLLGELRAADVPIVAYNGRYDLTVLDRECRRHHVVPFPPQSLRVIDPFIIDKRLDPYRKGRRTLEATAAHYGVPLDGAHDAEADAVATGRLAFKVLERLDPTMTIDELHATQVRRAAEQATSYQVFRRQQGEADFVAPTEWPVITFKEAAAA